MRWLMLMCSPLMVVALPRFDPTALLREVLIPADAAVGSVIYRLRASDSAFDYPLVFTLRGDQTAVSIDSLNCTRFNSVCQANVVLRRRLEPKRFYDFTVGVTSVRGDSTNINCSFRATDAATAVGEVFPGAPTLLMVSENARRNTELGSVIARGNPQLARAVLLELWGSPQFALHQKLVNERDAQGTILLLSSLDYETRTVHHLTILANDPWTNTKVDTRNIAGWPLLVVVLDEQDTPPIFTLAPPTTLLNPSLQTGDLVLQVHAEDGDRGKPRDVRYGLVSEENPFTEFFEISEDTGEIRLARPLTDIQSISPSGQPILLSVIAEEVRGHSQESPAQSSTVRLALIPPSVTAGTPIFGASEYTTLLDENSPTGSMLNLAQANIVTQPGDVVTLMLENNNGTFDISPSVVEGHSTFQIKVHDPKLLDYEERKSVECYVVAKEIGTGNFTAKVKLIVLLNDVNDNEPKFTQEQYEASIPENAETGQIVVRVEATDVDTEPGSKVRYTRLTGSGSDSFRLDPETGIITVGNSQGLDAETTPVFSLTVEAADEDGFGHVVSSTVSIKMIDINDQPPIFEKLVYEFIISPSKDGFTSNAFIRANDADITAPNNEVHYELVNKIEELKINEETGELSIIKPWTHGDLIKLIARAWDGGVPRFSGECEVRIYPAEGQSRKMTFIVPGRNPDVDAIASTLRALTGGRVTIDEVRSYNGYEPEATDISRETDAERSVVVATVNYSKGTIIDVKRIQEILDREYRVRRQETKVQEAGPGSLLWLVILFIVLVVLLAILLVLCCICERCPLYVPPKRRKIHSAEVIKFIKKSPGLGHESKSVQVAEWFGRREAWSPDQAMMDVEADESLGRHEIDRGSDRVGGRKSMQRQHQAQTDGSRDQFYIREGNTDILRLVTRGGEPQQQQQRPVTLLADQAYMLDSGKDILMRRYIEQQQTEAMRSQVLLPNAVTRLQTEHELLEASLRQQNALLRQILQERERDLRLETQSLPAGTQTDQDAGTQTDPQFFKHPRRKVHSDNDVTDDSDEDLSIIKERVRYSNGRKLEKTRIKRKIKTPIQEESEIEIVEKPVKAPSASERPRLLIKQTKTSELRQKNASSGKRSNSRSSKSGIGKEVLREISASLDQSDRSMSEDEMYVQKYQLNELYSEDSLEEISPRSERTNDSDKPRYHSETDIRCTSAKKDPVKSQSHSNLTKIKPLNGKLEKNDGGKRSSRYMEWYNKNKSETKVPVKKKTKKPPSDSKTDVEEKEKIIKETASKIPQRLQKETESSTRKKQLKKSANVGPEHPLIQHSEHRFEGQYLNVRRPEDDVDSGIALTRPAMAQKKSVFTIAYDDMHTSQLRPDSNTPPM